MLAPSIDSIPTSNILISEVLHVSIHSYDLFSLRQLTQLGCRIIFYYSGCTEGSKDESGLKVECMFQINTLHLPLVPPSPPASVSINTSISSSFIPWHSRVGHAPFFQIHQLSSRSLLGFVFQDTFNCIFVN